MYSVCEKPSGAVLARPVYCKLNADKYFAPSQPNGEPDQTPSCQEGVLVSGGVLIIMSLAQIGDSFPLQTWSLQEQTLLGLIKELQLSTHLLDR